MASAQLASSFISDYGRALRSTQGQGGDKWRDKLLSLMVKTMVLWYHVWLLLRVEEERWRVERRASLKDRVRVVG
jgi:hypothetical protein